VQDGSEAGQGKPDFVKRQMLRTLFGHLGHLPVSPSNLMQRTIKQTM
jgi:hypothetical protein